MSGLATTDTSFSDRSSVHREEKQRVAIAAAERIADGETVTLDGGATTQAVAHPLGIRRHLTIVTNNLRVPPALPPSAVRDVYLLGRAAAWLPNVTIGPVAFPVPRASARTPPSSASTGYRPRPGSPPPTCTKPR